MDQSSQLARTICGALNKVAYNYISALLIMNTHISFVLIVTTLPSRIHWMLFTLRFWSCVKPCAFRCIRVKFDRRTYNCAFFIIDPPAYFKIGAAVAHKARRITFLNISKQNSTPKNYPFQPTFWLIFDQKQQIFAIFCQNQPPNQSSKIVPPPPHTKQPKFPNFVNFALKLPKINQFQCDLSG